MLINIAAYLLVLLCFSLIVIRPRRVAVESNGSQSLPSLRRTLKVHPLIILICMSQLFVTAQATVVAIEIIRTKGNIQGVSNRAIAFSVILASLSQAASAALWFFTAVGLWRIKFWAYYVALLLNLLILSVSVPARFETARDFIIAPRALITLVLLVLGPVRNQFRRDKIPVHQSAVSPD